MFKSEIEELTSLELLLDDRMCLLSIDGIEYKHIYSMKFEFDDFDTIVTMLYDDNNGNTCKKIFVLDSREFSHKISIQKNAEIE